jgi:hypothetical protein
MHDPALLPVINEAVKFNWYHSHPHATNDADWIAYRDRILGDRPVTPALLDAAWLRYQNRLDEQNSAPREQRSEEPASDAVEDLNDLTDEEVEQVYKGTVRESARSARR